MPGKLRRLAWRTAVPLALLHIAATPPATAQWRGGQDAEVCVTGTRIPSLDIAVCGRALARNDLGELSRASVLVARGRAHRELGRVSEAISDFDAALVHNPYSASAYNERAVALDHGGRYERAIADFDRALALSPRFWAAYRNRAIAHFYAGYPVCARADLDAAAALNRYDADVYAFRGFINYLDGRFEEAEKDFARVAGLGSPYAYLPLWSFLSRAHANRAADTTLDDAGEDLLPGEWPKALLAVYRGKRDPGDLLASLDATEGTPTRSRRLAESHFYLGERELLNRNEPTARAHFQSTLALADTRFPERALAKLTLALLGSASPGRAPLTLLNPSHDCREPALGR